jgi:hypothetical protein
MLLAIFLDAMSTTYHILDTQIANQGAIQLYFRKSQTTLCLSDALVFDQTLD